MSETEKEILLKYFQEQRKELIEKALVEIPKVLTLLDEEIAKCDRQLKRWRGRGGFWRFLWDDIRGRTD